MSVESRGLHQTAKQLEFHPLLSLRTTKDLTNHILAWWKINLEDGLTGAPYVRQHCLPEMPP
jgi:hypothetical protein